MLRRRGIARPVDAGVSRNISVQHAMFVTLYLAKILHTSPLEVVVQLGDV